MGLNLMSFFDRESQATIVQPKVVPASQPAFNYANYGLVPNIAQNAQNDIGDVVLVPPPAFSVAEKAQAVWYTTRSHLIPLGFL